MARKLFSWNEIFSHYFSQNASVGNVAIAILQQPVSCCSTHQGEVKLSSRNLCSAPTPLLKL